MLIALLLISPWIRLTSEMRTPLVQLTFLATFIIYHPFILYHGECQSFLTNILQFPVLEKVSASIIPVTSSKMYVTCQEMLSEFNSMEEKINLHLIKRHSRS